MNTVKRFRDPSRSSDLDFSGIFRFALVTGPRLIAWMIGFVQGMGGGILNIRREVLEGAIA